MFSTFLGILAAAFLSQNEEFFGPSSANAADYLKPYKEKLFRYRKPIESADAGAFLRVPYNVLKDINGRDELPVRKVKGYYVRSIPKKHQLDTSITVNGKKLTFFGLGKLNGGSRMTVIFLHGRDGSRHLGFDDKKFGGNFNRLKNLMLKNRGIYISADFSDFKTNGKNDVNAIIKHFRPKTKGPLVVACGSMGSFLCWRLIRDSSAAAMIDGYVFLGGFPDETFLASGKMVLPKRNVPMLFAHGSIDSVYSWKDTHRFYKQARAARNGYPIRYVLFDTGKHGTPVRMVDWRDTLNWIASRQP